MVTPLYTMQRSVYSARYLKEAEGLILSIFRFIFKNNGVLFENDLIQIGVKSEYRQNLGRLGLFYGNKTQTVLQVSMTIKFDLSAGFQRNKLFIVL